MRVIPRGLVLLVISFACGALQAPALAAEGKPEAVAKWEYRVLTKEQVIDLGKKDLAAGLNQLGDEGWEFVAIDAAYIFKRPKDQVRKQLDKIKTQIALAESDVASIKDRVAWSERMAKKGYLSDQQVEVERVQLKRAEMALDTARRELKTVPSDPKEPVEKERKPEK
jgi:hypothetical protein